MREIYPVAEFSYHRGQVVVFRRAERARAEGDAVYVAVNEREQTLKVGGVLDYPRQTEYTPWRIVRMNSHFNAAVLAYGSYTAQEVAEIFNEVVLGHALVFFEQLLYLAHALGLPAGHCVAV